MLKYLKKSKVFGPIVDYFFRIEFQLRGSPHVHMLLWIAQEYLPNALKKLQKGDPVESLTHDDWESISRYKVSVYCARVPHEGEIICGVKTTPELVANVKHFQYHDHRSGCYKTQVNNKAVPCHACRFYYPRGTCESVRRATERTKKTGSSPLGLFSQISVVTRKIKTPTIGTRMC